jgi:hypothetical protein
MYLRMRAWSDNQRYPVFLRLTRDIIAGMTWGEVELEPEVRDWLEGLDDQRWAQAMFHLDLLEERGVLLGEPYTRQLSGKLRELRFYCGGERIRISYWIASGRRIVTLTVFAKTRMRETAEIARATAAMPAAKPRVTLPMTRTGDDEPGRTAARPPRRRPPSPYGPPGSRSRL